MPIALLAHGHLRDVGLEGAGVEAVSTARARAAASAVKGCIRVAVGARELRALLDSLHALLRGTLHLLRAVLNHARALLDRALDRIGALLHGVLCALADILHPLPETLLLLRLGLLILLLVLILILRSLVLGLRDRDGRESGDYDDDAHSISDAHVPVLQSVTSARALDPWGTLIISTIDRPACGSNLAYCCSPRIAQAPEENRHEKKIF